jgi:glucose/arabinose dehydrogenase
MLLRLQTFAHALAVAPLALAAAAPALAPPAVSTAAPLSLRLVQIGRFDVPTAIAAPPADPARLVVVERRGTIRMIRDGKRRPTPFLDIHRRVKGDGERGLLSIAFAPDYAVSGLFYVFHTALNGTLTIEEFRRSSDPDRADASSGRIVMTVEHRNHNHNSGQLQFGPDGYLYAGTGDGGNQGDPRGNAQNLGVPLGKILRLDPRGTTPGAHAVPADNPFVGRPGVTPEIWAYGLRNPWRFSFDRVTGDLAVADVGQDEVEEIDFRRKGRASGANFGWDACEGGQAFPPRRRPRRPCRLKESVRPSLQLRHTAGYCSAIGGFVVRDRTLASLYGRYVYGDLCKPEIRSARLVQGGAKDNRPTGLKIDQLTTFGEDARGRLHAGAYDGRVWRIAPAKKS